MQPNPPMQIYPQGSLNALVMPGWSVLHGVTFYRQGQPPRRHSLAELERMVACVQAFLEGTGLSQGDRVGILSRNRLEWVLLDLACLRGGFVSAGFEPEKFGGDADLIGRYGLSALLHDEPCAAARDPCAIAIDAVAAASGEPPVTPSTPVQYAPDDVVTIKFTSGSTGESKGLAATTGSIDQSLQGVQALFQHTAADRLLVFLPLSLLQQRYWIYSAILFGHDAVVTTPGLALEAVARERPTVVMGVPAFYETLKIRIETLAEEVGGPPHEAIRSASRRVLGPDIRYLWTGSAPARSDVLTFFDEACGVPLFEGYGMNETCIVTKNYPGAHRRGSAGKPLPGMDVTIDPNGMIRVRSAHPVNTAYLFAPPDASAGMFSADGSVRTGDLGRIDDDGYLWIFGRADDVIVLEDGRNILVRFVEEAISQHPAIGQVIVLGSGRPHLVALVYPTPGADPASAHAAALQIGASTAVRSVAFIEPLSIENGLLTSQGKPRRTRIAERYAPQIDQAYGRAV